MLFNCWNPVCFSRLEIPQSCHFWVVCTLGFWLALRASEYKSNATNKTLPNRGHSPSSNDWEQIIWPLMIATKHKRPINQFFPFPLIRTSEIQLTLKTLRFASQWRFFSRLTWMWTWIICQIFDEFTQASNCVTETARTSDGWKTMRGSWIYWNFIQEFYTRLKLLVTQTWFQGKAELMMRGKEKHELQRMLDSWRNFRHSGIRKKNTSPNCISANNSNSLQFSKLLMQLMSSVEIVIYFYSMTSTTFTHNLLEDGFLENNLLRFTTSSCFGSNRKLSF